MKTIANEAGRTTSSSIERRISESLRALQIAVTAVLDSLPDRPRRPLELTRVLKLNKSLSSRLARAIRTPDPLASAHLMPGSEGLHMVFRAAGRNGAPRALVDAAAAAANRFDEVVHGSVGGRAALDALISDTVPQARRRFEMANKQGMFKAISSLKGVSVDTYLRTYLVHPGSDPERADYVMLLGLLGLRRTRPRAVLQVANVHTPAAGHSEARLTLDGQRVDDIDGLLLPDYCSVPRPRISTRHVGASMQYVLAGAELGPESAVDVVIAELDRGFFRRYQRSGAERRSGAGAEVDQPARTLIFDVLLHEDVWPGRDPELQLYDMVVRGPADPNLRERDIDRLDLRESIEYLGRDVSRFRTVEIPNYVDMLRHVCRKMGWDEVGFRGYRCHIQYPFYGSQVCMVFDPPRRSGDGEA